MTTTITTKSAAQRIAYLRVRLQYANADITRLNRGIIATENPQK